MSHKKKNQKHVVLGVTLGLTLAVLTVSIASVTSLTGSVTPGYNCSQRPSYRWSQWQNKKNTLDVNADGVVNQLDADSVIGKLNEGTKTQLMNEERDPKTNLWQMRPSPKTPPFIDVNGDWKITSKDALLVKSYVDNCVEKAQGERSNPWHNDSMPTDVDGYGSTDSRDAMIVMGEINGANGARTLDQSVSPQPNKIDVNNDGSVTAEDYMAVMAVLNGR